MDHALVTGATGGLGEQYARYLASRGHQVILTARSADRLTALAQELQETHRVTVVPLPGDLSTPEGQQAVIAEATAIGHISVLVNNAGFGTVGDFVDLDPERAVGEIQVNCAALTALTRAFTPAMIAAGAGSVINIASTAAYQPIPTMAVYAATKAYVLSLSEALWSELRPRGVRVIAVCPGPTETAFFDNAGDASVMPSRRSTEQVVETTFKALAKGVPTVIDGPRNAVMAQVSKRLPVRWVLPLSKMYARGR